MYIIHIPELDFSSLFLLLLPKTFVVPILVFPLFKITTQPQVAPQAPCPRRGIHVLAPLDLHFEVDCFIHYHQMTSVLRDITFSYL